MNCWVRNQLVIRSLSKKPEDKTQFGAGNTTPFSASEKLLITQFKQQIQIQRKLLK